MKHPMKITVKETFRAKKFIAFDRLVSELEKWQKVYDGFYEKFSFLTKISEFVPSTLTKKAVFLKKNILTISKTI